MRKVGIIGAVVLALAVAATVYYLFFFGVRHGVSFIAALQSGEIAPQDITRVEVLRFNPSGGWPFQESEYAKLDRVAVGKVSELDSLLSVLTTDSRLGRQHRNHPGTLHWGILRIELQNGDHFYLYYQVERDQTGDFVSIDANSANNTNPNGATHYENSPFVTVLRRNDPWFPKQ